MSERVRFLLLQCFYCITFPVLLFSCFQKNTVEEHFKTHDMSYPVDSSGLGAGDIKYVGIERNEISAQEAWEYIEDGIFFSKEYFQDIDIQDLIPGTTAVVVSNPVLFRDKSGATGLMVKITAYGTGNPKDRSKLEIEWVGSDKQLWKTENFAYFGMNDFYKWDYKGLVY